MLVSYLSPLAPAAGLLLCAFILFAVIPALPAKWHTWSGLKYFSAPVLVGVAMLTLLGVPIIWGNDVSGKGLQLLSGWNFSTTQSVASLSVRVDSLSLPFLIVTFLLLFVATLLSLDLHTSKPTETPRYILGWLAMAAAACALFVSANGLTIAYAIMAFDVFSAFYWLGYKHPNLSVARIFLGIITAFGLMLTTTVAAGEPLFGQYLLGFALWLRLGFYPFIESPANKSLRSDERLTYVGLSLIAGIYLVARGMSHPLPPTIYWLTVATMLVAGLLTWLTGEHSPSDATEIEISNKYIRETRVSLITWLILTEALLVLLAAPLTVEIAISFAAGLGLSLVALWVTPALGPPRISERAWSWPYLPAVMATLTMVGVPFSLGWLTRLFSTQSTFQAGGAVIVIVVVLAEGLALSGLFHYWQLLTLGREQSMRRSVAGIVVMVPFLTPGLGPFILSTMTSMNFSLPDTDLPAALLGIMAVTFILAGVLGYFKFKILTWLKIAPTSGGVSIQINAALYGGETVFKLVTKTVLRIQVIVEGQHYLGWAFFAALVGTLIILLRA